VGKISGNARMRIQRIANLDVSFEFLELQEKVRVVGVTPEDLESGSMVPTLRLLWTLILRLFFIIFLLDV